MRVLAVGSSLLAVLASFDPGRHAQDEESSDAVAVEAPEAPENDEITELAVTWSEDHPPLMIPRGEHLEFRVRAGVGGLEAPVGSVRMDATVEPYRSPVLLIGGGGEATGESGRMRIHAEGDYQLFRMDATIETLAHPVEWPFLVYNFSQTGSKERRQELLLGRQGDAVHARYRTDTTKGAPKGSRIWKKPKERDLPEAALDMASATYFARAMIRENRLYMAFPVANKLDLWQVTLRRGKTGRVETAAGTFDAVQIILEPRPHPSEKGDEDVQERAKEFEGLFGLHGSISFWVEQRTGIPILITGEIPVGPIDIAVTVILKGYSGTPEEFRPIDG